MPTEIAAIYAGPGQPSGPLLTYTKKLENGKTAVINREQESIMIGSSMEFDDPAEAVAWAICYDNPLGLVFFTCPDKFQNLVKILREKGITEYPCPTNPPGDTPRYLARA